MREFGDYDEYEDALNADTDKNVEGAERDAIQAADAAPDDVPSSVRRQLVRSFMRANAALIDESPHMETDLALAGVAVEIERYRRARVATDDGISPPTSLTEFEAEDDPGPVPIAIEGVLVRGGIHVFFGPSGSCKSWAVLHAGLGIVSGMGNFAGIEEAPVNPPEEPQTLLWVYGSEDSRRRVRYRAVEVARQYPGLDGDRIRFADATTHPLNTTSGQQWLEQQIEVCGATFVVVDTVSSATTIKAKDGDEVRDFLTYLHALVANEATTVTDIGLVHHTRKLSQEARKSGVQGYDADALLGAGEWRNLTDSIVLLAAHNGQVDKILVQVVKSKDLPGTIAPSHTSWNFEGRRFEQIEVIETDEGNYTKADSYADAIILALSLLGGTCRAAELAQRDDLGVPQRKNTRADAITRNAQGGYISIEGRGRGTTYSLTTSGAERARTLGGPK